MAMQALMDKHVITYKWHREQKQHKEHHNPHVSEGAIVYAIFNPRIGKFFYYAYLSEDYAKLVCSRLGETNNKADEAANWRKEPRIVSGRIKD